MTKAEYDAVTERFQPSIHPDVLCLELFGYEQSLELLRSLGLHGKALALEIPIRLGRGDACFQSLGIGAEHSKIIFFNGMFCHEHNDDRFGAVILFATGEEGVPFVTERIDDLHRRYREEMENELGAVEVRLDPNN